MGVADNLDVQGALNVIAGTAGLGTGQAANLAINRVSAIEASANGARPWRGTGSIYWPFGGGAATQTMTSIGLNKSRCMPIRLPAGQTIVGLCVEVVATEAASVWRLGIYADANGYPGALLASGTVSGAAAAIAKTGAISVASTPLMWVCAKPETFSTGASSVRTFTTGQDQAVAVDSSVSVANSVALGYEASAVQNGVSGLAASFPAWPGAAYSLSQPKVGVVF